jgi:hypothetical protein
LDGDKVKINNGQKSVFLTYGNPEKNTYPNHIATTYNAISKDGKDCSVITKTNYQSSAVSISIFYFQDGVGFEYILE